MRGILRLSWAAVFGSGSLAGLVALCAIGVTALGGCDPCASCPNVTPPTPGVAHFVTSGSMTDSRIAATGTLLSNGEVLVTGGNQLPGTLDAAEIFDPSAGTFTATTGAMTQARDHHTATLLNDHTVLIAGGDNGGGLLVPTVYVSAELYDPTTNKFSATGAMFAPRTWHTGTILADGKVLVAGGSPAVDANTGIPIGALPNAELYDPSSKQFFGNSGAMNAARSQHGAALIKGCNCAADNQVLLTGGIDNSGTTLISAELFQESNNSFTATTGSMNVARHNHTATTLNDGKVLITGGVNNSFVILNSAEIFDPNTGQFTLTAKPMTVPRAYHSAQLLSDGRVLIVGGGVQPDGTYSNSAEIFDPSTGTFTATAKPMVDVRFEAPAASLPNGQVLVSGGALLLLPDGELRPGSSLDTAEIFSPVSGGSFAATSRTMVHSRVGHTATMLNDNRVLIAGGEDLTTQILSTSELYDPSAGAFNCIGGTTGRACASSLHDTLFDQTATPVAGSSQVLIAGGSDGTFVTVGTPPNQTTILIGLATAEIYNSSSKSFACVGGVSSTPPLCNDSMTHGRLQNVAVSLANGEVLLAGGVDENGMVQNTAEIFNPATGTFTATGSMNTERQEFAAALFTSGPLNGQVLVTGGADSSGTFLASAELYNPSTGKFTVTGSMKDTRFLHSETLLASGPNAGDMLVVAGSGDQTSELFDPASGSFKPGPDMTQIVFQPNVNTLAGGETLVAGGATVNSQDQVVPIAGAELYSPTDNQFTATDSMTTPRWQAANAFLDSSLVTGTEAGNVLIAGGEGINATLASSELFVPSSSTTTSTTSAAPVQTSPLTPAQKQQAVAKALAAIAKMAGHTSRSR